MAELLSSLMEFSYNTYIDILPKDKGNLKTNLNMNIFIFCLPPTTACILPCSVVRVGWGVGVGGSSASGICVVKLRAVFSMTL